MASASPGGAERVHVSSVDEALALVREMGGRATSSRRLLLRALFDAPGHRTAEELAAEVQVQAPEVCLSTIYRNLDELERLGVITHAHLGHGPATYHLAAGAHGHFVCEECGAMIEAPDDIFRGLARSPDHDSGSTSTRTTSPCSAGAGAVARDAVLVCPGSTV